MSSLELVFEHLDARRSRDLERLASQLDENVVHQGVTPELICHNRAEVLENIHGSFERDNLGVDRLEMIEAGDRVVLGLAGPRFLDVPWAPLNGQIYIVYTVQDGRIVRMEDFLNRTDALSAAGATAKDWV